MRCGVHRLAAGPDGHCALCRRDQSARPGSRRISPLGALLAAVAVLCVAAIAVTMMRRLAFSPAVAEPRAETESLAAQPAASSEPEPSLAEAPGSEQREPELYPTSEVASPFETSEPAASASGAVEAVAEAPASAPSQNAVPPGSTAPQMKQAVVPEQLRAAMQRVPITMYTTTWCKHCERARVWMRANSIPFTEHDVENSPSAGHAHKALNPRGGVPTIDIDGQVLVGFDEAGVLRALVAKAQQRMR